jgi:hypothetical protein
MNNIKYHTGICLYRIGKLMERFQGQEWQWDSLVMKHNVKHYTVMPGHTVQDPKIPVRIILTLSEILQSKVDVMENILKKALWSPPNSITGRNISVVPQWS